MSREGRYKDFMKCGSCGHSIDMHDKGGACRVHSLDGVLCDCQNFTAKLNKK